MTRAIDERDMSHQEKICLAVFALGAILLGRAIRLEALGSCTFWAFVELSIRITKLNGDVSNLLFLMSYSLCQNVKNTRKLTLTPEMALTRVDFPWAT